jgi:superfamily II DNA or RNA helicase
VIAEEMEDAHASGLLFPEDARTLQDQRRVRRATMWKRVEAAAQIAADDGPCIVWCELNDEADAVTAAVPGAVQVAGSDSHEDKAERLEAFSRGDIRVLVTKPSVAGFGMNWQHCARMVFVGASHSYEQTYQAIRRCWRFGQTRTVEVHTVRADTERFVVENYRRKEADAARLAASLREYVAEYVRADVVGGSAREWNEYTPAVDMRVPAWLSGKEAA